MSIVRDAERAAAELLDLLASRVQDDRLARPLQAAKEDSARHLGSIDGCLQTLRVAVRESRSDIAEGIRRRYETFLAQQPSEHVIDLFTAGTALRLLDFYMSGYRTLVDWSSSIDEHPCVQCFKDILTEKQKVASELDQFSHDIIINNNRNAPA